MEGREKRPQGQLRVSDQGVLAAHCALDVAWIEGCVKDGSLVARHVEPETGDAEAAADSEDDVGLVEKLVYWFRYRAAARAQGERVALGKGALALERRRYGSAQDLGELSQLVPGAREVDSLAGIDHGAFGIRESIRHDLDGRGVGGAAGTKTGRIVERLVDLVTKDVDRYLD